MSDETTYIDKQIRNYQVIPDDIYTFNFLGGGLT